LTGVLGVVGVAGVAVWFGLCWWCLHPALEAWVLVLFGLVM
jgi:hypothetical protein